MKTMDVTSVSLFSLTSFRMCYEVAADIIPMDDDASLPDDHPERKIILDDVSVQRRSLVRDVVLTWFHRSCAKFSWILSPLGPR